MPFGDAFETQTVSLTPKEKIEVIAKEVTALEEIYNNLETTNPQSPQEAQLLLVKIEQIYFAYQNTLNEINYDLMDKLKDAPNTKEFFTLFFKELKPETKEEKLIRWTNFKAKRSGELADIIIGTVPLLAKSISVTALLQGIYIRAVQKLANYIIRGKEIHSAVPPKEETLNQIEKEWEMLNFNDNATAMRAVFEVKKKLKTREEVIASGLVTDGSFDVLKSKLNQKWEKTFSLEPPLKN